MKMDEIVMEIEERDGKIQIDLIDPETGEVRRKVYEPKDFAKRLFKGSSFMRCISESAEKISVIVRGE